MRYTLGTVVIFLSIVLVSIASASEIYKWTDDQGNIHYTDKPDHQPSERLFIASRPTDNASVQAQIQTRRDRQAAAAAAAAAAPKGPTLDEIQARARERAENCSKYEERLTRFSQSRHLYREDKNGERVYLGETETQAAREKVRQQVEENCHS